jgi:hypothetical protein
MKRRNWNESGGYLVREQKSRIHWWMLAAAGLVALLLAPLASSWPDGLERVAEDHGLIDRAITLIQAPVPAYVLPGMPGSAATALAGLLGVAVTFAVVWGLTRLVLRGFR